mmetsp:Transcript_33443/g.71662  ORF Transcript_33443/g.71662 Transcript_33443/m.71662 type:complete len:372 (+) Transcript_33443:102-1217(+)
MSATTVAPPPLEELLTCADFERVGMQCVDQLALDYITGGFPDTIARNVAEFDNFLLRPRVLQDVSKIDTTCEVLGEACKLPVYLSSVAKGKLVSRQDGEKTFVRAVKEAGSTYVVPTVASVPIAEIYQARAKDQSLGYQFYLLNDEEFSMRQLDEAISLKASFIAVTVDANAPRGGAFRQSTGAVANNQFVNPRLSWSLLADIRKKIPAETPVYLKGVQIAEDALCAARLGYSGIIVSNHGGRSAPFQISSLASLEEIASALRGAGFLAPGRSSKFEVYFDGGVRSGRDIFKALCLGARAVGIGRPYYWASACYGQAGIVALLNILQHELKCCMEQAGATTLEELGPWFLARASNPPLPLARLPAEVGAKL